MLKRPETWQTWPADVRQLWDQLAEIIGNGAGAGVTRPLSKLQQLANSGDCGTAASALAAIQALNAQITPRLLLRNLAQTMVGLADTLDELLDVTERLRQGCAEQEHVLMADCMRAPRAKA